MRVAATSSKAAVSRASSAARPISGASAPRPASSSARVRSSTPTSPAAAARSEPAGGGDHVPDRRRAGPGQRGSRRHAGADREIDVVRCQLSGETGERIEQLMRDVRGASGVVLVCDRGAEDRGDPVAEQLERRVPVRRATSSAVV